MRTNTRWRNLPATYRQPEMTQLAGWIAAGESGAVLGLPGVGRATLLGYLCYRPDVLARYLPPGLTAQLVAVDLHNLPDHRLATFYRVILRAFYENREQFAEAQQQAITAIFRRYETVAQDAFLPQSGLRELLQMLQTDDVRVVLVLNRFDRFLYSATPQMTRTLRGLRDAFKGTLSYILGMEQEGIYLSGVESAAPLRTLLDTYVCWVGPLSPADGLDMIRRQTARENEMPASAADHLLSLTGGYPALLRVACSWWLAAAPLPPQPEWAAILSQQPNVRHRLQELWQSLTQDEQLALSELVKIEAHPSAGRAISAASDLAQVLAQLARKGVCRQTSAAEWRIVGELVAAFVAAQEGISRGKLWRDARTGFIYQGRQQIEGLAPQEMAVLAYLLENPFIRHTHDDRIENAWPPDVHAAGLTTGAVYQAIRGIRTRIEPDPSNPVYLITRRGSRDGGYQLFPEGRPQSDSE